MQSLMDIVDPVRNRTNKYEHIRSHWEEFRHVVMDEASQRQAFGGPILYSVFESPDNEVRFRYVGYNWYVRFLHDLDHGVLEYGLLDESSPRGIEREPCAVQHFDQHGYWNDQEVTGTGMALWTHLKVLGAQLPDAIKRSIERRVQEIEIRSREVD